MCMCICICNTSGRESPPQRARITETLVIKRISEVLRDEFEDMKRGTKKRKMKRDPGSTCIRKKNVARKIRRSLFLMYDA